MNELYYISAIQDFEKLHSGVDKAQRYHHIMESVPQHVRKIYEDYLGLVCRIYEKLRMQLIQQMLIIQN